MTTHNDTTMVPLRSGRFKERFLPPIKRKVLAFITNGDRLLVFRHPYEPEAGIQVPGGTIHEGEDPATAVVREAIEETGLTDLTLVAFLGERFRERSDIGRDEIQHRHYYHLRCDGPVAETWRHNETDPSEGDEAEIVFEFFWADLPDGVPPLIGNRDEKIPELLTELGYF